jgi:hypothetical protein
MICFAQSGERSLGFRLAAGIGSLLALVAILLTGWVSTSLASEHTEITGEYGKEGTKVSGIGSGCRIAYNSTSQRLYVFSDGNVYGLSVSPGTATPVGGKFPINTGINTACGEPDMEVESAGAGNIYAVQSGSSGKIYGWDSNGDVLASPWPVAVSGGGEICGVDVGPSGGAWAGNYSQGKVVKYSAAGVSEGTISVGFSPCKVAVDHANGDVFAASFGGGQVVKFTAASGYTTQVVFPSAGGEPGMAVNGAEHKLYVGNGSSSIKVYDTETAALMETVTLPGNGGNGIAVDEGTDTLFATVGSGAGGYIVEYLGLTTPKATTGEPTGNSEVSGTADPNGVGPITECYFEYGLTPGYGSKQNCTESVPFNSVQTVHASLSGLTGEETYHYRLVLTNGEPHVIGRGADKTIVPHNVKGLTTEPATEVTQESAVLNAKYEGTGEDTHYYFEWGQTTNYGHTTADPPGDDRGVTTGPTTASTEITGLEPGITYHYRVVAENLIGVSKATDKSFTTFELPSIDSVTSSHLTATSAEIDASINPHEFETTYFVEYGTSLDYGSIAPIPNGVLAAANPPQSVKVQLTELEGVPYHFRVVAKNIWGQVRSEDQSFNFFPQNCPNSTVRQQNESQYLPDCRAFELVSPEETGNILLYNAESTPNPYATDPPRFAFVGQVGGLKGSEPVNSFGSDTYVATRTNAGWKSRQVGLRGYEGQGVSSLFANPGFTKFLDFREPGGFEGEPQPPHTVPYIWDSEGNPLERWPTSFESIPGAEENKGAFQPSPDLTHLAISSSNVAFTPDGLTTGAGSVYDYDVSTDTLSLISKDANGDDIELQPGYTPTEPVRIFFPGGPLQFYGSEVHAQFPDPTNPPISTDGSHVLMATYSASFGLFTHPQPPMRLYMSVDRGDHYDHYEVSKEKNVVYIGMTADGSKVFFTSPEQLTGEDTDTSIDVYMWSEEGDKLTLVTKAGEGAEGSGNSDSCSASWISKCGAAPVITGRMISESGTDNSIAAESGEIYFYSPEQLDATKGVPNRENLYVYRGGKPQFVASLNPTPTTGENESGPAKRIQVSPDGSHMAFISSSRLTGYDNAGYEEMYSYDPVERKVVCNSCRPDGEPPAYNVEGSKMGLFMSDDGRTFFATEDPLAPTDTNEQQDVYEYTEGRPQLITTGTGTSSPRSNVYGGGGNLGAEGLAGVSADGINVYFSTRDVLVPQNHNGPFLAFYDARTNGGFPFEPPLAPCEAADECHGPGNAAPARPTVASEGALGERGNAPNPTRKAKRQKARRHKARRHHRHHRRHHRSAHEGGARHHRQGGN